jgi:hypothetical protein
MADQKQYRIYLAVPGNKICWGTVTGIINSTARHIVHPFNGGMNFNGAEDFSILWTDAINMFERGEIDLFAMLHGDLTPDPTQRPLDILVEEMEAHGADLVSTVSAIKDHRGVSSTGIADLDDPWRPFRRYTIREVLEKLPPTFDAAALGYPDRPLLHNTGLWICDLRKPVFRAANAAGELDLTFQFPTRSIRGPDGRWMHQRESEDWYFSRELWLRGVRNTWATSRVRLTHHGRLDYVNFKPWGAYLDGDEDTADKWRADRDARPLSLVQMLEFELGTRCNLGSMHAACPNADPARFADLDTSRDLDDDTIVEAAVTAYRDLGFCGLVGWIYYNEPLLEMERMFGLMARIKAGAPAARFILWTNGTLVPTDCTRFAQFEQIMVSRYNELSQRGVDRLVAAGLKPRVIEKPQLDDRLFEHVPADTSAPCLRPFVELVVDACGNTHLCCYDWRGRATWGNLMRDGIVDLARRWRETLPAIAGPQMTACAPKTCQECGHRWSQYQQHDAAIVARARAAREKWSVVSGQCSDRTALGAGLPTPPASNTTNCPLPTDH